MKILIDIGHPAHVHLFKNFAWIMQKNGHVIFFTCRDKEFEISLLEHYGFSYKSFGTKYKSRFGKVFGLFEFGIKEYLAGIRFKPDILLSHGSIYAAHASWMLRKPHITLEDTFNMEQVRLYMPFTDAILTADYDHPLRSTKVIKYSGYHELAYLHPGRFTPDNTIFHDLGLAQNARYVIMRFVSWNASHDFGHKGISHEMKLKAIKEFGKYARVFISSEKKLPEDLKKHQITIEPHKMHDAIAHASLVWGESFTIPAEATVLGVPAIINHNNTSLPLKEQEGKYGLCFNFSESQNDQEEAIRKGVELLKSADTKTIWKEKQQNLLKDKIDLTSFLIWFIENWPESFKIMKETPEYQERFK